MDEALFFWHSENELKGAIAGHVDDFFWSGNNDMKLSVIDPVTAAFQISSESCDNFNFLGLDVNKNGGVIEVDQSVYIESIPYVTCSDMKEKFRFLTEDEKISLRSAIGQLSWLANQTRPDISYEVCQLSVRYKHAQVLDILNANKPLKKLRITNYV